MDGWKYWEKKKVYIVLKSGRNYAGKILSVDDSSPPLVWITVLDKFEKRIMFCVSEIDLIQEEG